MSRAELLSNPPPPSVARLDSLDMNFKIDCVLVDAALMLYKRVTHLCIDNLSLGTRIICNGNSNESNNSNKNKAKTKQKM